MSPVQGDSLSQFTCEEDVKVISCRTCLFYDTIFRLVPLGLYFCIFDWVLVRCLQTKTLRNSLGEHGDNKNFLNIHFVISELF